MQGQYHPQCQAPTVGLCAQPLRMKGNHCACRFCEGKAPDGGRHRTLCSLSENSASVFTT